MRKYVLFLILLLSSISSYSRNYRELQEWRERGLPSQIKSGVVVEVYDLKRSAGDMIDINIRLHNLSSTTLDEAIIKVWVWKSDGVWVEEIPLVEKKSSSESISSGREKFFPGKGRYYTLGVNYDDASRIEIEISRVVSKRVR